MKQIRSAYFNKIKVSFTLWCCLFFYTSCIQQEMSEEKKPNIILILADDMGFSDIGSYGSEISTPNLDKLANDGLRFTQFYNGARCCPTRASLLTGLAPHLTGMGWMTVRNLGHESYSGELNRQCVTIAEVLKNAGYATFISGKWHLTGDENSNVNADKDSWPLQRGFDRFFGTILGAGSFYKPATLTLDNDIIEPGEDFFYTDAIVDHAIDFLRDHLSRKENPFFLYLPFTAPHWPLHARDSTISKYVSLYEVGWHQIRTSRQQRMINMGIIDSSWTLSPPHEEVPEWDSLDRVKKKDMIKRMATYAAQIEEMDTKIGALLDFLARQNQLDNSLVMFLADNGGCAEFNSSGIDKSTDAIGKPESFESYRLPWANASNTPFRLFKHWTHEGGIATPLVVHWPERISNKGAYVTDPAQIQDIMPTLIEVSEISYPDQFRGNKIWPIEGKSLMPLFRGGQLPERPLYWEHEANRAIRLGKWKLVSQAIYEYPFVQAWELYDMNTDRTESTNLASEYPEVARKLAEMWDDWAKGHSVYPLDGRRWRARLEQPILYDKEGNVIINSQ